jgi:hypothetical protein
MEYPSYVSVVTVPSRRTGRLTWTRGCNSRCCSGPSRSLHTSPCQSRTCERPARRGGAPHHMLLRAQRPRAWVHDLNSVLEWCRGNYDLLFMRIHEISSVRFSKSTVRTDALVPIQNWCIIVVEIKKKKKPLAGESTRPNCVQTNSHHKHNITNTSPKKWQREKTGKETPKNLNKTSSKDQAYKTEMDCF